MVGRPGTVERAFQIAREGEAKSFSEIARQLKDEGYGDWAPHLDGMLIRRQLQEAIDRASQAPPDSA